MPLLSIAGAEAFQRVRNERSSVWPDGRKERARLQGIPEVSFKPGFRLNKGEAIFTIGSCFARNIEARLAELGFELPTRELVLPAEERASDTENDLLNKYPPPSMLNELRWALAPDVGFPGESALCEVKPGKWHDPHLAGNVAHASLERVLERRAMVTEVYRQVARCRVVVITLGLVEAWFDSRTQLYLNVPPPQQVLQREPERFRLDVLSVSDCLQSLEAIHQLLKQHGHPDFRILLTVSPVPLRATFTGKDALIANSYSKSALRAAAESFVIAHEDVDYFPSYEIVTLAPRDAAFIQDNRHVTANLVNEVVDRVVDAYSPTPPEEELEQAKVSARRIDRLLKRGKFEAAAPLFKQLARNNRYTRLGWTAAEFHLLHGKTLARTGSESAAQIELARAVELAGDSPSANYNLGIVLHKLQRPIEAERYIRRAVELEPSSAEMRLRYARQLAANGDAESARAQVRIVAAAEPEHPALDAVLLEIDDRVSRQSAAAAAAAERVA